MSKANREYGQPRRKPGAAVIAAAVAILALVGAATSALADDQAAAVEVITLQQFVDQALAGGPDIRVSNANLGIAQAGYTTASAANQQVPLVDTAPSVFGSASGTLSATVGAELTGPLGLDVRATASHSITEDSSLTQTTTLGVNAGMNIWDGYPGGQALAGVRQAGLTLQGTQVSEDANRKTIIYQVKQAYYSLLAQQRQIGILQSTLAQRQEETRKTQLLYDAQSANQIDLKQSKVNETQARLDLLKAQDGLAVSRQQLSALVGWPIDKVYSVAEVADLTVPGIQEADAVKTALAQRSDMRQLLINQSAAEITLALKKGAATPTVGASAGLNVSHQWSGSVDSLSLSLGVTVRGALIDAGSAAAQAKTAELQAQKLSIQRDQLTATISTDVKNALASLRDLVARVDLAQASLDLAQNQYDLTKTQFDNGVSSNLDVLAASVSLTTAQVSLAKARADAQLGVLALQNELGN